MANSQLYCVGDSIFLITFSSDIWSDDVFNHMAPLKFLFEETLLQPIIQCRVFIASSFCRFTPDQLFYDESSANENITFNISYNIIIY